MNAALRTPDPTMLTIDSDVLGPLRVPQSRLVRFEEGLLGFPETRDFVLVTAAREATYWLQSAEHSSLIFLLVDPFRQFPDYEVDLPASDASAIGASGHEEVAIFTVVTLPSTDEGPATANLQGPLAINLAAGLGRQVVLRHHGLGVRREFQLSEPPAGG